MHPPVFSRAAEPMEAEHWLCTMEQKFALLWVNDELKVLFAAQQLQGDAGAWWQVFQASQVAGQQMTWEAFRVALR